MTCCPFCSSPAASWPDFASRYVKSLPLCEWHMSHVLDSCTLHVYDPVKLEAKEAMAAVVARMSAAVRAQHDVDEQASVLFLEAFDDLCDEILPAAGAPIRTYMLDEAVDSAIIKAAAAKFKKIESGQFMERCVGARPSRPDGRCTTNVQRAGELCEWCKHHEKTEAITEAKQSMFRTFLESLK